MVSQVHVVSLVQLAVKIGLIATMIGREESVQNTVRHWVKTRLTAYCHAIPEGSQNNVPPRDQPGVYQVTPVIDAGLPFTRLSVHHENM